MPVQSASTVFAKWIDCNIRRAAHVRLPSVLFTKKTAGKYAGRCVLTTMEVGKFTVEKSLVKKTALMMFQVKNLLQTRIQAKRVRVCGFERKLIIIRF